MEWKYERGEGRYKHRWKNDYAGFKPSRKGPIGKCPKSIDEALANEILNSGVPYYEFDDSEFPDKIFCLYRGVVYEAVPTQPGISWHGYPWRGDLPGRLPLPRKIQRKLEKMAKTDGYFDEYKAWMKEYSG